MNTKEVEELPELMASAAARKLNDDEMRNQAMQTITGTWEKYLTIPIILLSALFAGFAESILKSSGLRLSDFDEALLAGLLASVPGVLIVLYMHQRKLDAVIRILRLNAKAE